MIKHINNQNVSTTPFVAAKARALSNIQNADTVILEPEVYADGTNVSLDYVNYNSGTPIINRECDIALEQQDIDSLGYEEGITGSGTFNSASDDRNTDGTYKSLVHQTTKNSFYNSFQNPTKIFGVEHIDFPLSNTLRNLSDHFRMFNIPQIFFGDKIQPRSLQFFDTLLDNNVSVFDDGCQNLIAGYNLFSKVQEVRIFPSGSGAQNEILPGMSSYFCVTVNDEALTVSAGDTGTLRLAFASASIRNYSLTESKTRYNDSESIQVGYLFGSIGNAPFNEYAELGSPSFIGFGSGIIFNATVSGSVSGDTGSLVIGLYSGSVFDSVVHLSGSDSGSITNVSFYSGSVFNVLITENATGESGSITNITFYSGSVFNMAVTGSIADYASYTKVGFYSASVSD